jgi:hypothetical protein
MKMVLCVGCVCECVAGCQGFNSLLFPDYCQPFNGIYYQWNAHQLDLHPEPVFVNLLRNQESIRSLAGRYDNPI